MRLEERLSKKQKQQLDIMKSPKKEQLSKKDLEELMGTRRETYKRVHGAVRRK